MYVHVALVHTLIGIPKFNLLQMTLLMLTPSQPLRPTPLANHPCSESRALLDITRLCGTSQQDTTMLELKVCMKGTHEQALILLTVYVHLHGMYSLQQYFSNLCLLQAIDGSTAAPPFHSSSCSRHRILTAHHKQDLESSPRVAGRAAG